ncbi:MAG: DUF3098 domain-containing protein [Alistipes sp.]|nr:DUF3098 domain-containing protein [Alistipes sp.]
MEKRNERMPFTRKNYIVMLIGVCVIILGFVLMSGGGEHTATYFDESIFSFRRITLAPIVVIAGFVVEIYAIMKRFDEDKE